MNSIKNILRENISQMGLIENLSLPYIFMVFGTALLCAAILYVVYKYFYRGAVYSENYGLLLVITTLTVAFVIMTISSNLVLSLGMVGALSIVRFRAAVKDPLDVGFLFLGIGAGLAAGAGLFVLAIVQTTVICMTFMVFLFLSRKRKVYLLVIHYDDSAEEELLRILKTTRSKVKSVAKRDGQTEATYAVTAKGQEILNSITAVKGVEYATMVAYTGDGQY